MLPAAAVLVTLAFTARAAYAVERTGRPNIIVILTDDHGYADVGFHGCQDIPTPHLDALAKAGAICTDGYVTCPVCSPTRAGLLTGRYQQRWGFDDNSWSAKTGLSVDAKTVADFLQSAGYSTLALGKWHLGQLPQFRPLKRGFTDHYGFLGGGRSFLPLKESEGVPFVPKDPDQVDLWRNEIRVEDPPYLTDALGDEAVAYIDRHKTDPFFIYLAFNAPHVPLQATDKYLQRFPSLQGARRVYAAMLSAVDDAVGRITDKLQREQLDESTLIFFLSDNGGHPIANGAQNRPLRREKGTVYEGGIRVPFVVKWTGHVPAAKIYTQPVVSLDIAATALAAAGVASPTDNPLDGVDLIPYLAGRKPEPPHETLYWRFVDQRAIRQGKWKLMTPRGEPEALYDLATDLSESTDVAAANPEIVAQLRAAYANWDAQLPPARPRAPVSTKAVTTP
ncbi:MAG TPA: sulfatase-like hydrolase/transferase [Planctomycetaceae bacterium]|nr:sulfatase-like hydrolase/transferase [Planctomycetaceae bacterium]